MKVLSFTALAATLALSSFAFASPGGPVSRVFGEGQLQQRLDGYLPGGPELPPGPPPHQRCVTRLDEPMIEMDVKGCLPSGIPTYCKAIRTGPTEGVIIVNTIDGRFKYKWFGLADDHGKLEARVHELQTPRYQLCNAGVEFQDVSRGVFPWDGGY